MPENLIAFVIASIAIELTPGPNMAFLAILSLDRGRSAGIAAAAGVALGLAILGAAAGLGLGTLIAEVRWLYETLRWGGVLFLLWLAIDTWRDSRRTVGPADAPQSLAIHFRRGFFTNILNPKAAIFYVAVLPNFVDPARPAWEQSAILTSVYVVIATLIHAVVVLSADSVKPLLVSPKLRGGLGIVFALLLVAIAVWLAVSTRWR